MVNINALHRDDINRNWGYIKPFIEKALQYSLGEYGIDDIYDKIIAGTIIVLTIVEEQELISVVTLQIADRPQKRIVNVLTAGGDSMDEWIDQLVNVVDKLAKEVGADMISIHGRRGWERKLKQYKYKHSYTILTKEIL